MRRYLVPGIIGELLRAPAVIIDPGDAPTCVPGVDRGLVALVRFAEKPAVIWITDDGRISRKRVAGIGPVVPVDAAIRAHMPDLTRLPAAIPIHGFGQNAAAIPDLARVATQPVLPFKGEICGKWIDVGKIRQLRQLVSLNAVGPGSLGRAAEEKFSETAQPIVLRAGSIKTPDRETRNYFTRLEIFLLLDCRGTGVVIIELPIWVRGRPRLSLRPAAGPLIRVGDLRHRPLEPRIVRRGQERAGVKKAGRRGQRYVS